jgi:arsenite methyltransferase
LGHDDPDGRKSLMSNDTIGAINLRYSELAETSCCLSCGGAINHADARPGEVCVDLGSGRGNEVIRLAEAVGAEGRAFGIDISEGMLRKAERNAEKLGVKNAAFLKSELESLPFESGSVNLVISNCSINHARDKQAVWNEVYRILAEGGRFVVSDIYSTSEVPKEYRNDPAAVAECWAGSVERDVYLDELAWAGFREIAILEESKPYEKGVIQVVSWTIRGYKSSS